MNLSPYYILLATLGFIAIAGYLYGTFRKGSGEASAQSNQILRGLIDDQRKEIDTLKQQVAILQAKVEHNQNLEQIMQTALVAYFEANPTEARKLGKK